MDGAIALISGTSGDGVCGGVYQIEDEGLRLAIVASDEIHGRFVSSVIAGGVTSSGLSVAKPGRSETSGRDTGKDNGYSVGNERSVRLVQSKTMPLSTVSKSC